MLKRNILIVFLILMTNSFAQNLVLEKVFSLGEEEFFARITDCVVWNEQLLVLDNGNYCFSVYSKNGEFIKRVGRKGEGPGEFNGNVTDFFKYKNCLLIIDKGLSVFFHRFNSNFEYLNTYKHPKIIANFYYNNKEDAFILYDPLGNLKGLNPSWSMTDSTFSKLKEIKLTGLSENPVKNSAWMKINSDGNYVFAYRGVNKIQIYSKDWILLKETSLPGVRDEIPDDYNKKLAKRYSRFYSTDAAKKLMVNQDKLIFRGMVVDKKDNILVKLGEYSKNNKQEVVVFNKNLKIIAKFTLPNEGERLLYVDDENHLYTSSEENTILNKYKIKYELI